MDYLRWLDEFDIIRDGDYLGYSIPTEPEEFEPIKLFLDIEKDSSFILEAMESEQSYIWRAYEEESEVVIKNGFENDAGWYYVGRNKCKRISTKVIVQI